MAVQVNKRALLLIWLIALSVVLLFRNLLQVRQLTADTVQLQQKVVESVESEKVRWVSPRTLQLQQLLHCHNRELTLQKQQHGKYWVVRNLFVGRESRHIGCAESITYTTHGDYSFLEFLATVVKRWRAPVSFAIHAPGYDLNSTLDAIQYVRNCLPESQLISDYVSFHVYFDIDNMPDYVPYDEAEALKWPFGCLQANGTPVPAPYLQPRPTMYKVQANMTYPINVGRNIARQAANTHFVFACDIELYPSLDFVNQFLDMVQGNNSVLPLQPNQPPRVYALPVFEIHESESVPNDKFELMALLQKKRAQLFHVRICANCHKVPGHASWVSREANVTDQLTLFNMTRREGVFKFWEPFYVSDNREPFFDERVTWEGQSNKRIQGYAMCLLGYEYHVLHPAFLVHDPGFKKPKQDATRAKYVKEMNKLIETEIEPEYRVLYGENKKCNT